MPDKVYRLTYGKFGDVRTIGVFISREAAERQILEDVLGGESESVVFPCIEEWEIRS